MGKSYNTLYLPFLIGFLAFSVGCRGGFEAVKNIGSELLSSEGITGVDAGPDIIDQNLPSTSNSKVVKMAGQVDVRGNVTIVSYAWKNGTQVLSQSANASTLTTNLTLPLGNYTLTLAVTDSRGKTLNDDLVVQLSKIGVSPTPSPTSTPTPTINVSPTPSPTSTPTPTINVTPTPTQTPSPTVTIVPSPSPTPAPSTIPTAELPLVPSNFNVEDWVTTSVPESRASYFWPDGVGAFRFICKPSHNLYDDPIVYPNQPGASHLHTFFGNTLTNAHSTYDSLRKTGNGSCAGGPINRSAYWMPALQIDDGDGNPMNDKVVMPGHTIVYYKMSPEIAMMLPRGLRFIFGYNMTDPTKSNGGLKWLCNGAGNYKNLTELVAGCVNPTRIEALITAPHCWTGELDSSDHRSHIAEVSYINGVATCPSTHKKRIPSFTLGAVWEVGTEGMNEVRKWYLSSDKMKPGTIPGTTFHTDWFGAWDDGIMEEWMAHAVGDFRNASAGNLGNGRFLVDPFAKDKTDQYGTILDAANPRLVDPPPPPAAHSH